MKRHLSIIFSILIILGCISGEAWLLWPRFFSPYRIYTNTAQFIFFIGLLCTATAFTLYHIHFLVTLKKLKNGSLDPKRNFLTTALTWAFGISVTLWFLLGLYGFYSTFIRLKRPDTASIIALLVIAIIIFMNCFVWIFFHNLRKKHLLDLLENDIDNIGETIEV